MRNDERFPDAMKTVATLRREVSRLEERIIAGSALSAEIDAYVALQLKLADHTLIDLIIDPRD